MGERNRDKVFKELCWKDEQSNRWVAGKGGGGQGRIVKMGSIKAHLHANGNNSTERAKLIK